MNPITKTYPSWNLIPKSVPSCVVRVTTSADLSFDPARTALPRGLGRSYGDCCLNGGGTLFDMTPADRFVSFDRNSGLIRCQAGVTLAEILHVIVPAGWFLPATPGTKFVTLGGAIANDVHGKNHHAVGTFGRFVEEFVLARPDGSTLTCSPSRNEGMFCATIGGLGLTGVILDATIRLRKIPSPFIHSESIKFDRLEELFEIAAESDRKFEHTAAWVDVLASGKNLGRGIFRRGDHAEGDSLPERDASKPRQSRVKPLISVPFEPPFSPISKWSVKAFNTVYYGKQRVKRCVKKIPYERFFYPLDVVGNWNRLYGRRGFYQYQGVIPPETALRTTKTVLEKISAARTPAFLGVLKTFGDKPSPGLLSFPRPGITFALDFPNAGRPLLELFDELDAIVLGAGGALYPAKDARMGTDAFRRSFPRWKEFSQYVAPGISSEFWRRIRPA